MSSITTTLYIYLAPVEVWSTAINVSVCLSVCLSSCTSQKPIVQTSENVLYMLTVAVAQSSSDDNTIRYVLPVLWMTSYSHITGHMVRGIVRAVLQQTANSHTFPTYFTLSSYTMARNYRPVVKPDIYDCLVVCFFVYFLLRFCALDAASRTIMHFSIISIGCNFIGKSKLHYQITPLWKLKKHSHTR